MIDVTKALEVDPEDLTLEEIGDLEDVTGKSLDEIAADLAVERYSAKLLIGLIWIAGRRTDPEYTLEQARAVKVGELPQPNRETRRAQAKKGIPRPPR